MALPEEAPRSNARKLLVFMLKLNLLYIIEF